MNMGKPAVISSLAKQIDRFEAVDSETRYTLLGMRSRIGGPFVRETKLGSEISAAKLNRVRAGDFIYSRLFAWQGSFGIVPPQMDGCFVSNEFPIYELDRSLVEPAFLLYWFGLPEVQKRVEADCSSSTPGTRNRFKEQYFSALHVPLPTLDEQRNIAAKINAIRAKIDVARKLHEDLQADIDGLLVSMAHRNDLNDAEKVAHGWEPVALSDVLTQVSDQVTVEPGQEYPHFGIYSFAKGLFHKNALVGDEIKASKLYRVHSGQFIYGRLNAYEGAFAVVGPDYDKHHVSNEFPTFNCDSSRVVPAFLDAYFSSPAVWEALKRKVTGIGGGAGNQRIRLKESIFLAEKLWLPPIAWQKNLENIARLAHSNRQNRAMSSVELDALLPAILDRAFKGEL